MFVTLVVFLYILFTLRTFVVCVARYMATCEKHTHRLYRDKLIQELDVVEKRTTWKHGREAVGNLHEGTNRQGNTIAL